MSDPKILQLQKDLLVLGFDPGPIDGIQGSLTQSAAHDAYLSLHGGQDFTGNIPQDLFDDVRTKVTLQQISPIPVPDNFYDLTQHASTSWKKGTRLWSKITGITLHQTGCPMSESPSRWYGLKAHYGITYSGQIYQIRKETDFGWHAQGQSHTHIGIEIAGFFCGEEGNPKTRPGGPKEWAIQSVTPQQIHATKQLIRYESLLLKVHGSQLRTIDPHRTATNDRQPDPGSKVWKEIAIPLLQELSCTTGKVTGKGMPLPDVWSGENKGIKY